MQWTTTQIKEALGGRRILVVEDDEPLAQRIAKLFQEYTDREPEIARCMEDADKIIANNQELFSLLIIDVMLPKTHEDLEEIRNHEDTLNELRDQITTAGSRPLGDEARQQELLALRHKRSRVLEQIDGLIEEEGGIKLVEKWRSDASAYRQAFPVLYLTAVGNEASMQRGHDVKGDRVDWVVKPVPSETILQKSAVLLQGTTSQLRSE